MQSEKVNKLTFMGKVGGGGEDKMGKQYRD